MSKRKIIHLLAEITSANENSKVELIADTKTGEAQIVVSQTIIKKFPVVQYDQAMKLYEEININGKRKNFTYGI